MKTTLKRCEFCGAILKKGELNLVDKDIGQMCKKCFTWLNEEFIPLCRGVYLCR